MKRYLFLIVAGLGLWLAGCATSNQGPQGLMLGSVGPGPASTVNPAATQGTLQVFSAHVVTADFNSRDPRRPEYSDYRLLNADGKLLLWVQNSSDNIFQRPKQLDLPAGSYNVVAQANGYGPVTVPVAIEPGLNTAVHLEGGFHWPDELAFDPSKSVRLPNGEIVGWKSSMATK